MGLGTACGLEGGGTGAGLGGEGIIGTPVAGLEGRGARGALLPVVTGAALRVGVLGATGEAAGDVRCGVTGACGEGEARGDDRGVEGRGRAAAAISTVPSTILCIAKTSVGWACLPATTLSSCLVSADATAPSALGLWLSLLS